MRACVCICEFFLLIVGEASQNICCAKEVDIGADKDEDLCSTAHN